MTRILFFLSLIVPIPIAASASDITPVDDAATACRVIVADAPASSGLAAVVVADDLSRGAVLFSAPSGATFSRWDSRGAAWSQPVAASVISPGQFLVTTGSDDCGISVSVNGRDSHFWIINYAHDPLSLSSLDPSPEASVCGVTALLLSGSASPLVYYSINGVSSVLSRDLTLVWSTLEAVHSESDGSWQMTDVSRSLPYVSGPIEVDAPLCATGFTLSGDRFSSAWGFPQSVSSPLVQPSAVSAIVFAEQHPHDIANEQTPESSDGVLGGSAPVDITFSAIPTDAASFHEWQISRDPEFFDIDLRYSTDVTDVTFSDQGTFYVRYVCADPSGECEFISDLFTVSVGESALVCPNAFSPLSSPGVNDEWRVSYKSIIDFDCVIVNRWGTPMAHLTHPSQGWDGRHGGKLVPAGVYFYVISARGADGRVYNLKGDINIVASSPNR